MEKKQMTRKQILDQLAKVYNSLDMKVFGMMTLGQLTKFYSQSNRV